MSGWVHMSGGGQMSGGRCDISHVRAGVDDGWIQQLCSKNIRVCTCVCVCVRVCGACV